MSQDEPLTNSNINDALEQLDSEKQTQDNFKILIIDDDSWIHRIMGHYLQSWGFTPISAMDAFEGIALAIKHRPILIILDIVMPEVKGDSLLKMLKAIDLTTDIPVLILSGNLNMDILGSTFKKGAAGFIAKPFTQEILFDKMRDCLGPTVFTKLKNIPEFKEKQEDAV